jgi:hypothetical protein
MKKDLFEYFTTDNISGKKCTEKWLCKNNNVLYNEILDWCEKIKSLRMIEFKRKVYHFVNEILEIPSCKKCGDDVNYIRFIDGYSGYCSQKCVKKSDEYRDKWLSSWKENNSDGKSIEKRNKTLESKYGKDYNNVVQKKREKALLDKYGVVNSFQINEVKDKRKLVLMEKYGSETYNNPDKTRWTRISNGTQINDEIINDFIQYKKIVINRTISIYRNNEKIINPSNLKRGMKSYHIDHKFSIKQGFLLNLPIEIITHPCNLHMVHYMDNLKKQDECWITETELLNSIIEFDKDIVFKHNHLRESYVNVVDIAKSLL